MAPTGWVLKIPQLYLLATRNGKSEIWLNRFEYKESGPYLLMMAFLQRVINGGGSINREYALGRKRVDILIIWKNQRIVIELKILRGPTF